MKRLPLVLPVVCGLASGVLMFMGQTHLSPVNDEPANIPTGYMYLRSGKIPDPTHPPLIRYLMALPLVFMVPSSTFLSDPDAEKDWHLFGRKFLFNNEVHWQAIVWATRSVIIFLSLLLLLLVFLWAKQLWGLLPAAIATIFLAFEPTLMGHGSLATLDAGASLFFFACVFAYWHYRCVPSKTGFFLFALCLALALMSKFSNAVLLVATPITGLLVRAMHGSLPSRRFRIAALVITLLSVSSICYGFRARKIVEDPQIIHNREAEAIARGLDSVAEAFGISRETLVNIRIPLYDLLKGLGLQVFHAMAQDKWEDPEFYQYLNGEYSRSGWRTYYLWTFILKSTIPTLVLCSVLLILGFKHIWRAVMKQEWQKSLGYQSGNTQFSSTRLWPFLSVPPFTLFVFCSLSTIAIGHRYLLPIYPFIAMGAGFITHMLQRSVAGWIVVVFGIAWHVVSALSVWPHQLAYFNEAVGGPRSGWHYLADSNLDWGQDLLYLKEDVIARLSQGVLVYGDVFGTVRPEDLGFSLPPIPDVTQLRQETRAVTIYLSINRLLLRSKAHPNGRYSWVQDKTPPRFIGVSIVAFDLRPPHSFR